MGKNEDVKREIPLQAVLITDSFNERFRPLSDFKQGLFPLCNLPMLEYSMECLAASGVEELIIFSCSNSNVIEEYLKNSKALQYLEYQLIVSTKCLSIGDVIRDLDVKHVIRSDPFILITSDIVSNINLKKIVQEHKLRKKKDASSIMTLVLQQTYCNHPLNSLRHDLLVGMDESSKQIVMYDDNVNNSKANIPTLYLKDHEQIRFHYDLIDCHIDICSPDILVQFSDNFDYANVRKHFICNEVQNYELGNKIHGHIVKTEYAAKVQDPKTYHQISMDILQRWAYPIVPDNNILNNTSYGYQRGNNYKEKNVVLERSSRLEGNTLIGSNTIVGSNSSVQNSTIGRNCKIGNNVNIVNSHLWDNVEIQDHVTISDSILARHVQIFQNAKVSKGCLLDTGVVIGKGFVVPEYTKITLESAQEDDFGTSEKLPSDGAAVNWKVQQVGENGKGRWMELDEEELSDMDNDFDDVDSEDGDTEKIILLQKARVKQTLMGCSDLQELRRNPTDLWENSSSDGESLEDFDEESAADRFARVVREMVISADQAGHDLDNIFLEIKSFKFAQNRTFVECLQAIIPAILSLVNTQQYQVTELVTALVSKLKKWTYVLKKCVMGNHEEEQIVKTLEAFCVDPSHSEVFYRLFRYLLQSMYQWDLVSEHTILTWYQNSCNKAKSDELSVVHDAQVINFIEWLQQDEESDSD